MPHKAGDIFREIVRNYPEKSQYWLYWLKNHWQEVTDPNMATHCWPIRLDRTVLIVGVDSSVWNQAVFIQKKELLRNIELKTKEKFIKEIKGIVSEKPVSWPPIEHQSHPGEETFSLESEVIKKLEQEAAERCHHVHDANLRDLLQKMTLDFLVFQQHRQGG